MYQHDREAANMVLLHDEATATTNPDPNGLSTKNPFADPFTDLYTASSAWETQSATNSPALAPTRSQDGGGLNPILLAFNPSGGSSVTYTIKTWFYFKDIADTWFLPQSNGSLDFTGIQSQYIMAPPGAAIFLEVDSISSGNLDIYFDNNFARSL